MTTRLACVVFDAIRPRNVARFWAELLDWQITVDRPHAVEVAASDPDAADVSLMFVPTAGPKSGKNRIHLDVVGRSLDHQRVQVDRALALGARPIDIGQGAVPWTVLADPEGNEFCVLEPREEYVDTGAVAAIVVDTPHPTRLARFWETAAGWPLTHDESRMAGIRSATGQGPWLEFLRTQVAARECDRVHLDVVTYSTGDPADEVARLTAAGAVPCQGAAVHPPAQAMLTDPETNRFRLLRAPCD
ncbi:VOC family protein [Nocardia aobensis]|uniref:VOC family protein n=1 Tax=Nocardia aobensis TaxID=257277 RepID=A0ABW6PDI5_9NOCA|nr:MULTISPECIES: VOC family protein [Nocardia]PSR65079.1 VOC family protein [Nocardia sp. MDA0666]